MYTPKQIEYWRLSGKEDLEVAEQLIKTKREIHGLFFCHLAIEKIIKAHIAKITNDYPPRIHALSSLLSRTGISVSKDQHELMGILMKFQIEGRYSENYPKAVKNTIALEILNNSKLLFQWLETKL